MNDRPESFVHVLLFQCQQCGEPLAKALQSVERSLEEADATSCNLRCACGWSDNLLGVLALKHWVAAWRGIPK